MRKTLIAAALAVAGFAVSAAHEDEHGSPFVQVSFLTGDWIQSEGGKTVEEHWAGPAGGVMAGSTITYADGDATGAGTTIEFMSIVQQDGRAVFVARLGDQPPVAFPLKESDNGYLVFENPAHDFPQRIIYTYGGDDTLDARIEGVIDGKAQSMEWRYTRMKRAQ